MNRLVRIVLLFVAGFAVLIMGPGVVCAQDKTQQKEPHNNGSEAIVIPGWAKLQAGYTYAAKRAPVVTEVDRSDEKVYRLHITLTGLDGEKAPGTFVRPKAPGVYPVVLLLHGLTSDKETMLLFFGQALVAKGIAVLALDAPYHGERKDPNVQPSQPTVFPEVMRQGIKE